MTNEGKIKLKQLEGLRLRPYMDAAKYLTIGFGHCLTKDELTSGKIRVGNWATKWDYRQGLTLGQCADIFEQDIKLVENAVKEALNLDAMLHLKANQFDALVMCVFNIGIEAFRYSTLRKKLIEGKWTEVPEQMRRWKYAGGSVVPGLVARREEEIQFWNKDTSPV